MKPAVACFFLALSQAALSQSVSPSSKEPVAPKTPPPALTAEYGKLPLSFEANQGQSDARVKFLSHGNAYSLFLTDQAAVLALSKKSGWQDDGQLKSSQRFPLKPKEGLNRAPDSLKTDVVRMELAGASHSLKVEGTEQLPGTANYFIGNDPAKWRTSVPTFAKVKYAGVYPGVDLVYYGNQRQLEYDFVVSPGADPKLVKLHFAGAGRLRLTPDGDLMVVAKNGEIAFHKPVVYQVESGRLKSGQLSSGQRDAVNGRFVLLAGNSVGFAVGSYDRGRELVIDPILAYSTYLGGTGNDLGRAIAVSEFGDAYVTGYTFSAKFPTKGSIYPETNAANGEAFVTKLNPAGTALVYSTYLGGSGGCSGANLSFNGDAGYAVAVDTLGRAYVAGQTCSEDFPLQSPYQSVNHGYSHHRPNAFIARLNASGTALEYSTYLGGTGGSYSGDFATGITVDGTGSAYISGFTASMDFPLSSNPYQNTNYQYYGNSGFVTKFTPNGSLAYSTYFGGTNTPSQGSPFGGSASAIAIDSSENVYLTGATLSNYFPVTSNAPQQKLGGGYGDVNAYIAKLNSTLSELRYSTYLGGTGCGAIDQGEFGLGIAADSSGNAYVAGETCSSTTFPTKNPIQAESLAPSGAYTGFVTKIDTVGGGLVYSTYLGGNGGDAARAIALDSLGHAFITGSTNSTNFPLAGGPYQGEYKGGANNPSNAFLAELDVAGSKLLYSTYLGGSGDGASAGGDTGYGIALDSLKNPYVAGYSYSADFPTLKTSFQPKSNATPGNSNAFVARFVFPTATTTTMVSDDNPAPAGANVTFTAYVPPASGSEILPTGTVTFSVDGGAGTKVALDDAGHAAFSTASLPQGAHTITATYSGDVNYKSSSATLSQTIYGSPATLTIVHGQGQKTPEGSAFPTPLTVIAKDSAGDPVPNVDLTFSGSGLKFSPNGYPVTGANGEASVTATAEAVGSLTATAKISGTTNPAKIVTFYLTGTASSAGTANSGDPDVKVVPPPPPTFTPPAGTYSQAQSVGINHIYGALVYYTTNGATPTTGSTRYTGPFSVAQSETVKAIAVLTNGAESGVATGVYTIR